MTESIWDREDFRNAKWWKKLWLFAVDGFTNKRGEGHIPDDVIKDIARFLLPNIKAFFDSDEGKAEFEKGKMEQKRTKAAPPKKEKSGEKSPL